MKFNSVDILEPGGKMAKHFNFYRISRILILSALMPAVIFSAMQASEPEGDFHFTGPDSSATVPFDLYFNLIFLQAQINDSQPLWFILDSGFEESVVNTSAAQTIGLKIPESHIEKAPGGDIEVSYIDSLAIHLTGIDLLNQQVAAIPLDQLEPIVGRRIDGILGHDFFARFVVQISYSNQQIILRNPLSYVNDSRWSWVPVTIENHEPFLTAILETEGFRPVKARLKIDTGSADVLGLNGSFVKAENLVASSRTKIPAQGAAVGGHTENFVTRLRSLTVGDIAVENPIVGYSVDTLRSGDAGTIAGEFFRRFDMVFDYQHGKIYFIKNKHFDEPFEYDMSGIFPIAEPPEFKVIKVLSVTENTPASEVGIKPDDIIVMIDGKPAGDYSIAEIRRMFMRDGKTYRLKIERGLEYLDLELKLRRLI